MYKPYSFSPRMRLRPRTNVFPTTLTCSLLIIFVSCPN